MLGPDSASGAGSRAAGNSSHEKRWLGFRGCVCPIIYLSHCTDVLSLGVGLEGRHTRVQTVGSSLFC